MSAAPAGANKGAADAAPAAPDDTMQRDVMSAMALMHAADLPRAGHLATNIAAMLAAPGQNNATAAMALVAAATALVFASPTPEQSHRALLHAFSMAYHRTLQRAADAEVAGHG